MATVLSIVGRACLKLGVTVPDQLYASTNRERVELAEVANACAETIMRAHDWNILKTVQTDTGDGSTTAFDLPTDFDRMTKDPEIWSSAFETALHHIADETTWLAYDVQGYNIATNRWSMLGGQVNIKPALASGVTAKYYYISNKCCANAGATPQALFTADDDTFRLDDELLRLALIWTWREQKKIPYAEDLENCERLLAKRIMNDGGGARVIRAGGASGRRGVRIAYPKTVPTS